MCVCACVGACVLKDFFMCMLLPYDVYAELAIASTIATFAIFDRE